MLFDTGDDAVEMTGDLLLGDRNVGEDIDTVRPGHVHTRAFVQPDLSQAACVGALFPL